MTATTSTLTDRYVDLTLRRLPAKQRPDIERELRASIADAIDDRTDAGSDPAEAEHAVLTELGDPARLAADYADRPLHLIGPSLYLDYIRLIVAILVTVVPATAAATGFIRILRGGAAGPVIGDTIGTALTTTVHIVFWTTLLFAVIERTSSLRAGPARQWTPDALPQPPSRRARHGAVIAEIVMVVLFAILVMLSPVVSTQTDATGDPIGILSPWLWQTGVVYVFLGLAIAALGVTVAKSYVRWSVPVAVTAVLLSIATTTLLIWIAAGDRLLNPAFVDAAGWPSEVAYWTNAGLIIAAVLAVVHAVVEAAAGFAARSWVTPSWKPMIHTIVEKIPARASRR
ncbi:permease prefix domain 1-containing protein [Acrocarpospora sp. B8E8]|uniref:permease prefix domain 1-containing protein n=1 Tax=Acrocarpospora sp. B8E8 TaxID=3153572 RepID=UPI00325D02CC